MDLIRDGVLWKFMVEQIAQNAEKSGISGIQLDTENDVILCNDESAAEIIADFLEKIGYDVAKTGTYDEECGTVWYYIDVE